MAAPLEGDQGRSGHLLPQAGEEEEEEESGETPALPTSGAADADESAIRPRPPAGAHRLLADSQ